VIRSANDFEWFCLLEGCHEARLIGGRRFLLGASAELVQLIRAPRIQLVVFRQSKHMFETAINALDSF
jgi:hypothetical protein